MFSDEYILIYTASSSELDLLFLHASHNGSHTHILNSSSVRSMKTYLTAIKIRTEEVGSFHRCTKISVYFGRLLIYEF